MENKMKCKKHIFEETKNGKAIFCKNCGKVVAVPCRHIWKQINAMEKQRFDETIGYLYTLECQLCGDIKFVEYP